MSVQPCPICGAETCLPTCGRSAPSVYCESCMNAGDVITQQEETIGELQLEIQQLKHELRKYQPSDAMMVKLLGLNDVIREAARIFALLKLGKPGFAQVTLADLINWLEHPTVVRAVTSPMAQAKVKP